MPGPDDLAALKAEREAADREYNEALTRLDRAIQQLPATFPHPPPAPDEQQVTPLNTLWKIDTHAPARGWRRGFVAGVRRAVAPLFEQQQAFNSALVDHVNIGRKLREMNITGPLNRYYGRSSSVRLYATALNMKSEISGKEPNILQEVLTNAERRPDFWKLHPVRYLFHWRI